jgi:hypothetical protein
MAKAKTQKKNVTEKEGREIARLRWEKGMSLTAIAKLTGRTHITIRKWAQRFMPNQETLNDFAEKKSLVAAGEHHLRLDGSLVGIDDSFEKSVLPNNQSTPLAVIIETATQLEALNNELEKLQGNIIKATEKYEEAIVRFKPRTLTR